MKRTLVLKIFGVTAAIVLLLAASIALLTFRTVRREFEMSSARHLESLGRALQRDILAGLDAGSAADLESLVRAEAPEIGARVTVIDPDGTVLADSERDPAGMENHRYRPEVSGALEGRIGESTRFSYTVESRMLYVGIPLVKDGRIRAVLRLSYFLSSLDRFLGRQRTTILRAALIVTVVALLAALAFALHLVRPIRRLTQAAGRMAEGDFSARVRVRNRDEIKDLADGFNAMAGRIQALFVEASSQRENLLNIIGSIQEGLAVVDRDGRIVLANASFRRAVREEAVENRFFWEVLRQPKMQEMIAAVRSGGESLHRECRMDDRSFFCNLSYLPVQDGVVLVFHDLTELRRVEDLKKDFVVNASHELRTPLQAIRGAADLLEEGPEGGDRAAALEILRRHTDRLTALVDDLLKLGELEDRGFRPDVRPTDLKGLAAAILKSMEPAARKKGLDLALEAAPDLPLVPADADQIERALLNLLDNAVKYTDRGRITVRLRTEGESAVMDVADTGPGIPAEHQARIFERFYVVDKSRSRRLGGTGLGLAIVKHVAQLHGGSVEVRSEEGRGATFTLRIPLRPKAARA